MNFLAHLFLSGSDPELLVGNLMGDFVKGRLSGKYPPGIEEGIRLHRRIDSFCSSNPQFIRSRKRISPSFGHFRSVLVDVYYDHFLATCWDEYSCQSLQHFLEYCNRVADSFNEYIPANIRPAISHILLVLLPTYARLEGVGAALKRMSQRVSRENRLADGEEELRRLYGDLKMDFRHFFPQAIEFAQNQRKLPDLRE